MKELIIKLETDADLENNTEDTQIILTSLHSTIKNTLDDINVKHSNLTISTKKLFPTPEKCLDCNCIGDYTTGPYRRNPHYCCELVWKLLKEDYRVDPYSVDKKCPLKYIDIEKIRKEFYNE